MKHETKWLVWFGALISSLLVLEIPAVAKSRRNPGKPSGTLTYWFRGILGTRRGDKKVRRWLLAPGFVVFCAWLAGHMSLNLWDS